MRELFVYYRVPRGSAAAAVVAVTSMQAALRAAHPDLVARLLRRSDDATWPETWMETYALPEAAGGIDTMLQADIEAAATPLQFLLDGERHVEVFETFMSETPVSLAYIATPESCPPRATGLHDSAGV